jgi:hypothetical protein
VTVVNVESIDNLQNTRDSLRGRYRKLSQVIRWKFARQIDVSVARPYA